MNWSGEQRRLLDAMGFQVLGFAPGDMKPATAPAPTRTPAPPAAPLAGAQADAGTAPDHAPLQRSLSRVAGGRDLGALVADWPGLRNSPALKRALWSRIKAMRRER